METRSQVLRRRHRRILRWSLAIAALLHVAALWFLPWFRPDAGGAAGAELVEATSPIPGGVLFNVYFGPPAIVASDDSVSREPASRFLKTSRVAAPPAGCRGEPWMARESASGSVRLVVAEDGHADATEVLESSGSPCWDHLLMGIAGDLRFHWIPNSRFPAPVVVHQPVTLSVDG